MVISFSQLGNYGRLGNQMFQYATIRSVGLENNFEFQIPINKNITINKLNIIPNLLTSQLKFKYTESSFHYNSEIFKQPDGTDFSGYFQSYKYFQKYQTILFDEFKVNQNIDLLAKQLISKILYSNHIGVISVHIRRGDYLKLPKHHPFCGLNYYTKAINEFRSMGNYGFIICSDDLEWCKKNIKGNDIYYSNSNGDIFIDMAIMYNCDHNIIANSSFSWWGAWLNKNPNKIILYPSVWFGPQCPQDWYDLIPPEWEKIEV